MKSNVAIFLTLVALTSGILIMSYAPLVSKFGEFARAVTIKTNSGLQPSFNDFVHYRKRIDALLASDFFPAAQRDKGRNKYTTDWKTILFYTPFFGDKPWPWLGYGAVDSIVNTCKCKIKECVFTFNNSFYQQSDAVVFHGRDVPNIKELKRLRKQTLKTGQRWVYYQIDSAAYSPNTAALQDLFNLTMNYKEESDIWTPYGKYVPLKEGEKRPLPSKNYAAGKKPGAAWVVTHCGVGERDEFVNQLQELYPVYVGGGCRSKYKRQINATKNYDGEIKRKFKYYLAFENSFCRNYMSEKYWHRSINNNVVPIVMGAGAYDRGLYGAIPHSYINVVDFASVKELAAFLHYLDDNDDVYNEFFKWKQAYKSISEPYGEMPTPCTYICELCELVHIIDFPIRTRDIGKFYNVSQCQEYNRPIRQVLNM